MNQKEMEDALFDLISITKNQQRTAQEALADLKIEREALAKERAQLQTTIETAIQDALSKTGQTELQKSAAHVTQASAALTKATSWLSLGFLGACLAGLGLLLFAGFGFVEWKKYEFDRLEEKIQTLEKELPGLEAQAAEWEEKAGRATLTVCGPKRKPCVRVNKAAGVYGSEGDHYILHGY